MSIATEILSLSSRIQTAFDVVESKGGTIPESKTTYTLSTAIESIPSGGGSRFNIGIDSVYGIVDGGKYQSPEKSGNMILDMSQDLNPQSYQFYEAFGAKGTSSVLRNATKSIALNVSSVTVIGPSAPPACYYQYAFLSNPYIEEVILSGFESPVDGSMGYMFYACPNLKRVKLAKAHYGSDMFYNCSSLTSVDASEMTEANASRMFAGCSALTSFEAPILATFSSGGSMLYMFSNCVNLISTDVLAHLPANPPNFTLNNIFNNCISLKEINCSSLTSITNNTSLNYICYGCTSLSSANFHNLQNINYSAFSYAFYKCSNLSGENVDFSNLTRVNTNLVFQHAFRYCAPNTAYHFPALQYVKNNAFMQAWYNTPGTSAFFESLTTIDASSSSYRCFYGIQNGHYFFPELCNIGDYAFAAFTSTYAPTVHLAAKYESTLTATTGYATRWGAGTTYGTFVFDL